MKRLSGSLIVLVFAGGVSAAPFQNGSFEFGPPNPCNTFNVGAGSTIITGWTVSVGNIDWESAPGCGWQPSNGSNSLDLVGSSAGGIGGIQQTFDTVPGVTYQVSFDLSGNYGAALVIKPLAVTINGVTTNYTFDTTGRGQFNMGWTPKVQTFVAAGSSSTINFVSDVSGSGGTLNAGAALDNVQIVPFGAAGPGVAVPLDWAHMGATALILLAGMAYFTRRRLRARR